MPTKKKMAQDLRDAGLRKKSAWELVEAADQARSGDRAARSLVDRQSTALRDGISAAVRHAKPPQEGVGQEDHSEEANFEEGAGQEDHREEANFEEVNARGVRGEST